MPEQPTVMSSENFYTPANFISSLFMSTPIYLNPELSNSCYISSTGLRCEVGS